LLSAGTTSGGAAVSTPRRRSRRVVLGKAMQDQHADAELLRMAIEEIMTSQCVA
jgi:hypothetical protein